jgi:hypothetical protein
VYRVDEVSGRTRFGEPHVDPFVGEVIFEPHPTKNSASNSSPMGPRPKRWVGVACPRGFLRRTYDALPGDTVGAGTYAHRSDARAALDVIDNKRAAFMIGYCGERAVGTDRNVMWSARKPEGADGLEPSCVDDEDPLRAVVGNPALLSIGGKREMVRFLRELDLAMQPSPAVENVDRSCPVGNPDAAIRREEDVVRALAARHGPGAERPSGGCRAAL